MRASQVFTTKDISQMDPKDLLIKGVENNNPEAIQMALDKKAHVIWVDSKNYGRLVAISYLSDYTKINEGMLLEYISYDYEGKEMNHHTDSISTFNNRFLSSGDFFKIVANITKRIKELE